MWKHYMERAVEGLEPLSFPATPPRISGVVPDVVNAFDADDARLRADLAGFTIRVQQVVDDRPPGHLLSQSPLPGESMELGRMIVLFVSGGEFGSTELPDLVGLTQSIAIERLNAIGQLWELIGTVVTDPSQHLTVRTVTPPAGTEVNPGSTTVIVEIGCYLGDCSPDAVPGQ
jgi:beta-lactam-binding protein with PASTA domain